jgi:hypothetical protein
MGVHDFSINGALRPQHKTKSTTLDFPMVNPLKTKEKYLFRNIFRDVGDIPGHP